jgi:glycerol uptake facilitator-like aquaporin
VTVFIVYVDTIESYPGNTETTYSFKTAGIFATYPASSLSGLGGFVDQYIGTMLLIIVVLSATDHKNNLTTFEASIYIGSVITAIGTAFSYNAGYAINPARDFSPRFFTLMAGMNQRMNKWTNYCHFNVKS